MAKGISSNAWKLYIQSTWVPGEATNSLAWELQRVNLARQALKLQPDFGQAHAVLADKLSYLANVDPQSDTQALHDEADAHAARPLNLPPMIPMSLSMLPFTTGIREN